MDLKQIESAALHLPTEERAALASRLLLSLESRTDAEIAESWLVEARVRAKELDAGIAKPIPAEEARRKARALLR